MLTLKPLKAKACTSCLKMFIPARSMQAVCSPRCAVKKVRQDKAEEKAKIKTRRAALKKRSEWLADVQREFNRWIRLRDAHLPCVSCGRHHQGKWNAGHYLSVGARPELRFEPLNVWRQCEPCNTNLSGNLILYRIELVKRIGAEKVEWLEGHHEPKRYKVPELEAMVKEFRARANALEKQQGVMG